MATRPLFTLIRSVTATYAGALAGLKILSAAAAFALVAGCAAAPTMRAWRPWLRVLPNPVRALAQHASIGLQVEGVTEPLVGKQAPLQAALRANCTELLMRQGFAVTDSTPTYHAVLRYHTSQHDIVDIQSSFATSQRSVLYSGASSIAGALGGGIASAVVGAASSSSQSGLVSARTNSTYAHSIALELTDNADQIAWQGEARWQSNSIDLVHDADFPLRLLASKLPRDHEIVTHVDEINTAHVSNYYRLYCNDQWFACPGIPFIIGFDDMHQSPAVGNSIASSDVEARLPSGVRQGYALAAYRDLVQSADRALPLGLKPSEWRDPLSDRLWSRVRVGGRYTLGPGDKPVAILVTLKGSSISGAYIVKDAHVATDDEYAAFEQALDKWRTAIERYYDVTVRE